MKKLIVLFLCFYVFNKAKSQTITKEEFFQKIQKRDYLKNYNRSLKPLVKAIPPIEDSNKPLEITTKIQQRYLKLNGEKVGESSRYNYYKMSTDNMICATPKDTALTNRMNAFSNRFKLFKN
jgi:uncharacterized protein YnzC (UPF0291/DUF896 family)